MRVGHTSLLYSFRLSFRSAPLAALLLVSTTLVIGLVPGLQAWVLTALVEQLSRPSPEHQLFGVPVAMLQLSAISIGQMLINVFNQLSYQQVRNRMHTNGMEMLLRKASRLSPRTFDQDGVYDQLHRAKTNVHAPFDQVRLSLDVASIIISLLSFLFYVQALNVWLAVVFAVCMGLYAIQMYMQSKVEFRMYHEHASDERELNYLAGVLSQKSYGKEVRVFGLARHLQEQWSRQAGQLTRRYLQVIQKHHVGNLLMTSAGFTIVLIFFAVVAASVGNGSTTAAAFAGLVSFIGQLGHMISSVGSQSRDLNMTRLRVRNMIDFLGLPEEEQGGAKTEMQAIEGGLQLRNVSFHYPGQERPALREISLDIRPGETIGIVGENGAGKSTLAHLLSGVYQPTSGEILLDGTPYREIAAASMAAQIGVVHQKPIRYELTFRENVLLDASTDERLGDTVRDLGLEDILAKLPEREETVLGKMFGNVDLSGGEWQRVAIARCYQRAPQVYILDEPTSALDPENEAAVFRLFRRVSERNTSLIISHRLGSIRDADRIVVLKEGRVAEVGTHEELMVLNCEYARLYQLQAQWYQEGD